MSADAQTDGTRIDTGDVPRVERCETCRFWHAEVVAGGPDGPYPGSDGMCLRYPPVIVEKYLTGSLSVDEECDAARYPMTGQDDWCGEWQSKNSEVRDWSEVDVANMDFSIRACNAMESSGILKVGQLLRKTPADLLSIRGFSYGCLANVREHLTLRNLRLRGDP